MKIKLTTTLGVLACAAIVTTASAQTVVIDDFETGNGRFSSAPNASGTSTGFNTGSSTVTHATTGGAFSGSGFQTIFIDDSTASVADGSAWRLRHLSGGGTPANNLSFSSVGFVGYALKTTTPDLFAGLIIDDGPNHERAEWTPIIADGLWHIYEWNLADANQWAVFAGATANGAIDGPTVTIDSIYIRSVRSNNATDVDALFSIDFVAYNNLGSINPVPEPSTIALGALGGFGLLVGYIRRRRS